MLDKRNQSLTKQTRPLLEVFAFAALVGISTLFSNTVQADTNIVWSDEFNGTSVDTTKWTFDIGNGFYAGGNWVPGWGNKELEYYTSRTNNVYVAGGYLHIYAQQESYGGQNYTSARLKSMGLFSKKYGRFEFRAKLPTGTGFLAGIMDVAAKFALRRLAKLG